MPTPPPPTHPATPVSCPTPGKTVPCQPLGGGCQVTRPPPPPPPSPPPPPGEPYSDCTRTFSGTEIALQNERIQHTMRSKGCQCAKSPNVPKSPKKCDLHGPPRKRTANFYGSKSCRNNTRCCSDTGVALAKGGGGVAVFCRPLPLAYMTLHSLARSPDWSPRGQEPAGVGVLLFFFIHQACAE